MPYRGGGVPQRRVILDDAGQLDAFGRLRVSEPQTLFETQFQYNSAPLFWDSTLAGGGTATHLPNEAAIRLRVADAENDQVIRQTRRYIRYQPGKSQLIKQTFVMGAADDTVRRRVGYFDASNGLFLEQQTGMRFIRRTYVSGTATDTKVEQADWNLDPMDGTGPSGITLDFTKSQILFFDIEWLGVGRVRCGFFVDGAPYFAHAFYNTNSLATVYMTTANLPLRYEITRTAAGSGNADLYQICSAVESEGGRDERAITIGYNMLASRAVSNADLPVLSIQLSTVFPIGGTIPNRETVIPSMYSIYTEDAAIRYHFILNGTLTSPSWQTVNSTSSGVQYDVSATAISGGTVINGGGYVVSTQQSRGAVESQLDTDLFMSLNSAGDASDVLSIVCQRLTATNSDTWCSLTWKELY